MSLIAAQRQAVEAFSGFPSAVHGVALLAVVGHQAEVLKRGASENPSHLEPESTWCRAE
jgi:hypothetical protein